MVRSFYEMVFKVTETCNNGNERNITKSVMSPHFRNGKHFVEADRVEAATKVLAEAGYYNIEYQGTKVKKMLFVDED